MAGAPTTIYRREGTLLIPGTCAVYCAGPITRSCWGKGEPSVARPSEPLFGGAAPVGGTCPGIHPEIRCVATTLQSSYIRFSLGQSSGFLPRRGSFTCTSAASLCPGAPSGNGPQTNRRCLVDFVPTYLHLPPHLARLVPILSLVPPHCSLVCHFPCTIPYYTVGARTSIFNGVSPFVHKPLRHCPMQHLSTIANAIAIYCIASSTLSLLTFH